MRHFVVAVVIAIVVFRTQRFLFLSRQMCAFVTHTYCCTVGAPPPSPSLCMSEVGSFGHEAVKMLCVGQGGGGLKGVPPVSSRYLGRNIFDDIPNQAVNWCTGLLERL